jgi:hypothetical protein
MEEKTAKIKVIVEWEIEETILVREDALLAEVIAAAYLTKGRQTSLPSVEGQTVIPTGPNSRNGRLDSIFRKLWNRSAPSPLSQKGDMAEFNL